MVRDEYGIAVEWLTAHPKYIFTAWRCAVSGTRGMENQFDLTMEEHQEAYDRASCLFKNCGGYTLCAGCLTQIAHGSIRLRAETDELTDAIRADRDNIPMNGYHITVEDLPKFAEWRRRIDAELGKAKAHVKA